MSVRSMVAVDGRLYVYAELPVDGSGSEAGFYIVDLRELSISDVSDRILNGNKYNDIYMEVDEWNKRIEIQYKYYDYDLNKYKPDAEALLREMNAPEEEKIKFGGIYKINGNIGEAYCEDRELEQIFIGYFHEDIYQYFYNRDEYRMIYDTSSEYCWPTSVALGRKYVFFGTRCDGLIVADRKSGEWKRYSDSSPDDNSEYAICTDNIETMLVYDDKLYIGGRGLFAIDVDKFDSNDQPWNPPGEMMSLDEL